jgi:TrmH family RNA methyltransferase
MLTKNQIKLIKSLQVKKNRYNLSHFIIEGEKMVDELLLSKMSINRIFGTKKWIDLNSSKLRLVKSTVVTESELEMISNLTKANNVLALVNIETPRFDYNNLNGITLILDEINDPGNLGTIIRLCDWFNISNIICSKNSVDLYNSKVVQSSMGSLFRVNIFYKDLISFFNDCPYKRAIYGTFLSGINIKDIAIEKDSFIIMGNEANGISKSIELLVDKRLTINNIGGKAESLNIASATSIVLYQFS